MSQGSKGTTKVPSFTMKFILNGQDNAQVTLTPQQASMFKVLANMMEDTSCDDQEELQLPILVDYASQQSLDAIYNYVDHHQRYNYDAYQRYTSIDDRIDKGYRSDLGIWTDKPSTNHDTVWLESLDKNELKQIAHIAHYLDARPLYDTACKGLAKVVQYYAQKIIKAAGDKEISECLRDSSNIAFHEANAELAKFLEKEQDSPSNENVSNDTFAFAKNHSWTREPPKAVTYPSF